MDIIYIAIVVLFFVMTWGLMKMCENLGENKSGEQQ